MTDLTVRSSSELATPDAVIAQMAAKLKNNINVTAPMVSCMRNGKLKLPDDTMVESLDIVLLDFVYRNQYYPKPFQEGTFNEMECQAIGEGSNDVLVPLDTAKNKQAESCAACPKNQYGSHPAGGRGKACQNQIILAVTDSDWDEDGTPVVWTVKAQPTALKQIGTYMLKMTELYGHPIKVVTTLSLDENSQYPKLQSNFSAMNPLWDKHITLMEDAKRALYSGAGGQQSTFMHAAPALPEMLGG